MWRSVNDIDRMFGAMDLFRSQMNRLFRDFDRSHGETYGFRYADGLPRTNLYDNGDRLEIMAEIPGLSKDDINIKIQGNYLELSGSRKSQVPEGYQSHRVERGTLSFTRSFTLPSEVDVEKAEASLKDGILTLSLPKVEAAKPKQITVN
jgi:HSP20 family protein